MQADEGFIQHFGEGQRRLPGQLMPDGHREHQAVAPVGLGIQATRVAVSRHHPDVRLAGRHCLNDRRARLLFQADPDTRLFAQLIALVLANTVTWLARPLAYGARSACICSSWAKT